MNVIQLSDLHLCEGGRFAFSRADSTRALRETVDYFLSSFIDIDAVIVCGDVSNDGSPGSYQTAKSELARLPWPVYYIPGNHDNRLAMQQAQLLPQDRNQAACRRLNFSEASIILLDSVLEGQSRGGISDETLKLLENCLSKDDDRPTFLFMHHVPFCTGYSVMDEPFEQVDKLMQTLSDQKNLHICCGHIHASIATRMRQISVCTCSPVCMAMEFDLTPQGGNMFYTSEPQFALHAVKGTQVITHFVTVPTRELREGPYPFWA